MTIPGFTLFASRLHALPLNLEAKEQSKAGNGLCLQGAFDEWQEIAFFGHEESPD